MSDQSPPDLHLLVGINGAGKTTFYYDQIKPRLNVPFINADEIQKQRWPNETNNPQRSYEAAEIAKKERAEHVEQGKSFAAETVFSHPSKLELITDAQAHGFRVSLYHIHVATPELAKKRVQTRTEMGGHDVPQDKIESRFPRTLAHLQDAVKLADRTMVFDNSEQGKTHRHLMTLARGQVTSLKQDLPDWAHEQYGSAIQHYKAAQQRGPHYDKADAFKQLSRKELLDRYPDDPAIETATVTQALAGKFADEKLPDPEDRRRFLDVVRDRVANNLEHGRENSLPSVLEGRGASREGDQER